MKEKINKIIKITLIAFLALTASAFWAEKAFYFFTEDDFANLPCHSDGDIGIIEIKGDIIPYFLYSNSDSGDSEPYDAVSSEEVIDCIKNAEKDDYVQGVIFVINSYGGSPVASEEIMNAVKRFNKPSVAVVRESGTSGAYLIASAADRIFASELSDVGSIGVTMSYLDYSQKNTKEGITYQELSSAKFKNYGDPDKPLTTEEKELIERDLKIIHESFVKHVSKNRSLDIEKVKKLADGSLMLGQMAKEDGLIDEIGSIEEARLWLKNQ